MPKTFWCLLLLLCSSYTLACVSYTQVRFGIVPWSSAEFNLIWSNKVKAHLYNHCIRGEFSSAPDFERFIEKSINHEFDVAIVPPHIGSFLVIEYGMPVIAIDNWDAKIILLTQKTSSIQTISDLDKIKISLPDPLSYVSMWTRSALQASSPNMNFHGSNNHALQQLLDNKVQAAVLVSPVFNHLKPFLKDKIRVAHTFEAPLNGLMVNTNNLDHKLTQNIFDALQSFDYTFHTSRLWQTWSTPNIATLNLMHMQQAHLVDELREIFHQHE
ncbi:MAG: PhnD/SsuA/transferrin family substrate-binding protein [Gammaproteobacteria bacterium]|nr:PhnD/SsuA/transferrin family substrate-binding protein [Gammaproteobacteria bacterium]